MIRTVLSDDVGPTSEEERAQWARELFELKMKAFTPEQREAATLLWSRRDEPKRAAHRHENVDDRGARTIASRV